MHLTILTADLSPPPNFAHGTALPALATLRDRCDDAFAPASTLESQLLQQFAAQTISPAVLTALVDMPDVAAPQGHVWLRADPVHLAVSRDNVQLFDSHVVKPAIDEMALIAATINKHFAEDNVTVSFPDPARGYIAIPRDAAPETTPLWRMMGANVFDYMPSGVHGAIWRTRMNEIQMLLHDHPVNLAREARGERAINGLWCWGSGDLATPPAQKFNHVVGRLALLRGITTWFDMPITPLPATFQEVALLSGHTLIVLHQATRELRAMSFDNWQHEAMLIDRDWLSPALTAFDAKQIESLNVIVANDSATEIFNVKRMNIFYRLKKMIQTITTKKHHA